MGIWRPTPTSIAEAVCRIRRRKLPDPRFIGNVGSVFKNPTVSVQRAQALQARLPDLLQFKTPAGMRLSAAQLLDKAGCKGQAVDGAAVWPRQPLVLVQRQRDPAPTSEAFIQLLQRVQFRVAAQFGITLETEPQRLGN